MLNNWISLTVKKKKKKFVYLDGEFGSSKEQKESDMTEQLSTRYKRQNPEDNKGDDYCNENNVHS